MATASGEPEPTLDPAVSWIPGGHSPGEQGLGSDLQPMLPLNPPATAAPGCLQSTAQKTDPHERGKEQEGLFASTPRSPLVFTQAHCTGVGIPRLI